MGLLGLVGHPAVVYRVLLRPVGFLLAVVPAMVVDFSPGSMRLLPGTLVAFVAPFLAFIALKRPTTLVDWQGIGLDSSRLIKRSWILIWPTEVGSNIPIL